LQLQLLFFIFIVLMFPISQRSLLPGFLLFVLSLLVAVLIYQDFGISWDEPAQHEIGMVSYNYVTNGDPRLDTYFNRDYGVFFELPLIYIEKWLNLTDSREIYLMRHIATHILYLISAFCGYVLALRFFKKQWLACLAFLMLVFHPRLYGHSFFNTKDIPLMSFYTISLLAVYTSFTNKKWGWAIWAGIAAGATTSIRILGIMLVTLTLFLLIIELVTAIIRKERISNVLVRLLCFFGAFCITLYITWPSIWVAPVKNLVVFFDNMSHFRWDAHVLFNGESIRSLNLPASYLPTWISITTPVIWLLAAAGGIVLSLIRFFRSPLHYFTDSRDRQILVFLGCSLGPVLMVILLHSVVYDDWRHVYFIYPSLVMLALYALDSIKSSIALRTAIGAVALQCIVVAFDIIQLHPFEHVYFNRLVSRRPEKLRQTFELDYWGVGFKQALEHMVTTAPDYTIKVAHGTDPLYANVNMLQQRDRPRFVFTNIEDADYVITNFRGHPDDLPYRPIFTISRMNNSIICVYKK